MLNAVTAERWKSIVARVVEDSSPVSSRLWAL